jgi:hypothetical protein
LAKMESKFLSLLQRIYNPIMATGVFGNVYLLALDNTTR